MIEKQEIYDVDEMDDIEVDRREETLVTRLPGYIATEQIVQDVAEERRLRLFQVYRVMWTILAFLEILLGFRFILRMIAANPDSGFAMLIYGVTGVFAGPFNGMISTPTIAGMPIEVTTLIAMFVYALIFWGVAYIIWLFVDRPQARSIRRTVREQTPGGAGSIQTTRTTISNRKS